MNGKKVIVLGLAILFAVYSTGCVSSAVMNGSKKKVALRKAMVANDDAAIKAIRMGGDAVGVGIDVTNWEALTERPWLQAGAAILDALILYGTYEGARALDDAIDDDNDGSSGSGIGVNIDNSSGVEVNVIQGDSNSSNQDKETSGESGSNDIN